MPCDGTAQDYRRHSHRGEDPCPESREAWRVQVRYYSHTGLYESRDPEQAHPFMYATPKKHQKRDGEFLDRRNKSKSDKDPRNG